MSTRVNGESIFDRTSDRLTDIISYINQVSRTPGPTHQGLSDDFGDSFGPATDRETMRDTLYGDSTVLKSRRDNQSPNVQNTTNNSLMVDSNNTQSQEYSAATSPLPFTPQ